MMMIGHVTPRPGSRQAVIQSVRREAAKECPPELAGAPWIDRCVDDVVTELWENPVKSFVPLLAMRHVRCCIQAGSCDCGEC